MRNNKKHSSHSHHNHGDMDHSKHDHNEMEHHGDHNHQHDEHVGHAYHEEQVEEGAHGGHHDHHAGHDHSGHGGHDHRPRVAVCAHVRPEADRSGHVDRFAHDAVRRGDCQRHGCSDLGQAGQPREPRGGNSVDDHRRGSADPREQEPEAGA